MPTFDYAQSCRGAQQFDIAAKQSKQAPASPCPRMTLAGTRRCSKSRKLSTDHQVQSQASFMGELDDHMFETNAIDSEVGIPLPGLPNEFHFASGLQATSPEAWCRFFKSSKSPPCHLDDEQEFAVQEAICESLKQQQQHLDAPRTKTPSNGHAESFAPKKWLNDASIAYVYSLYYSGQFQSITCPLRRLPDDILLMEPAAVLWLSLERDVTEIERARQSLKIHKRRLILCPINDSRDTSHADSGNHWSLLVCWASDSPGPSQDPAASSSSHLSLAYFDSMARSAGSKGHMRARSMAKRLVGHSVQVPCGSCALQTNSYDCGMYVLVFSELIITSFLSNSCKSCSKKGEPVWADKLGKVTARDVTKCRDCFHSMSLSEYTCVSV